jgi:hypothetical protein
VFAEAAMLSEGTKRERREEERGREGEERY